MSQTVEMNAADSVTRESDDGEKKIKSRRPPNTAFRQQRLKAWQPILTPKTVLPIFFLIGIIMAPLGAGLLYASTQVQELSINYSECGTQAPVDDFAEMPSNLINADFKTKNSSSVYRWRRSTVDVPYGQSQTYTVPSTQCTLEFDIPNAIGSPVFLYYRLTKFYQNHRRYVKSLDEDQIEGQYVSNGTIGNSDCDPLRRNNSGFAYYPCGLIANSWFNDTINSPTLLNPVGDETFNMTNKGIAWGSDQNIFKNTVYNWYEVAPPPNWMKRFPDGYSPEFPIPNLNTWEELQVWMRTAGLPTFSKLALRADNQVMPAGTYQMNIIDDFPVTLYGGTKEILISTRTVIGGKNHFLGIAYIVVGGLCLVLGALFLATHLIRPRKLGDHNYLTWNTDHPSTANTRPGGAQN